MTGMPNATKLVAMDLDGTLTQHRSPLDANCRAFLERLHQQYRLVLICAGGCERVQRQLGTLEIDIIGYYGLEDSLKENHFGVRSLGDFTREDHDHIRANIAVLRKEFNVTQYTGDGVEFHLSGVITFPLLGTLAPLAKKLAFDPMRVTRRRMYHKVSEAFPHYNVFIGGSSSFDLVPKPHNKYFALRQYLLAQAVTPDETIYFGDDFGFGGNDSSLKNSDIECIEISHFDQFPNIASKRLFI